MRPQDIVILLKILTTPKNEWQFRDLAAGLDLSVSEISESLVRSHIAGLVDQSKRKVYRESLWEFIEHGIHYVFPQQPGTMVNGIPTAHSYPEFKKKIMSDLDYVWPHENGNVRGLAIKPLYKGVTNAIASDNNLYRMLAAIDILRVGKVREMKLALKVLETNIIQHERSA
ncbi:MAG: hypothetical protein EOO06_13155 [Chitinophagaceae bacterium]|nr:MAG: hypothetical protein EOO06_13155 [Chitinophagaceae bacterium]